MARDFKVQQKYGKDGQKVPQRHIIAFAVQPHKEEEQANYTRDMKYVRSEITKEKATSSFLHKTAIALLDGMRIEILKSQENTKAYTEQHQKNHFRMLFNPVEQIRRVFGDK